MIREIEKNEEKSIVLKYIGDNYFKCLYLYIDLTYYSLENGEIKCWVQYDKSNIITLVMLQYHSALHVYSEKIDFNMQELLCHLDKLKFSIICGKAEIIEIMSMSIPSFESEIGYVGRLYEIEKFEDNTIELATINDIRDIAEMVYSDEDSGASYNLDDLVEQMTERFIHGFSRNMIIRENGLIVANTSTGGETEKITTLNNVIVRKGYRRRGLAKRVYLGLCNELLSEGKEVYSIYYVPESVALHKKMGFVELCKYGKLFTRTH